VFRRRKRKDCTTGGGGGLFGAKGFAEAEIQRIGRPDRSPGGRDASWDRGAALAAPQGAG
jgi:hypothetical protein